MLRLSAKDMLRHICAVILVALIGCDAASSVKPYRMYRGGFDTANIELVESILDSISQAHSLRVFRKDRHQMATLTNGKAAFFTALYFHDNPVLVVTNVGVGDILHISVTDFGHMPLRELIQIAEQFTATISQKSLVDNLSLYVEPAAT